MGELRRSIAILYAGCQKFVCCFMCVIFGLTTVDKLEVFFYIHFCCFSIQKVLFLAINDAMASSPQEDTALDS